MSCPVSQVTSGSPRMQTWPPGAQSTVGGTENHPGGCTLGRAVAPQTAGFPLAPKNLAVGGQAFTTEG